MVKALGDVEIVPHPITLVTGTRLGLYEIRRLDLSEVLRPRRTNNLAQGVALQQSWGAGHGDGSRPLINTSITMDACGFLPSCLL